MTTAVRLALVLALLLSVAAVAAQTAPAQRAPSPRIYSQPAAHTEIRPHPRIRIMRPLPRIGSGRRL